MRCLKVKFRNFSCAFPLSIVLTLPGAAYSEGKSFWDGFKEGGPYVGVAGTLSLFEDIDGHAPALGASATENFKPGVFGGVVAGWGFSNGFAVDVLGLYSYSEADYLGVQSRHLVDRVQDESVGLGCPDLADVFVWCEPAECLEPAGEVVGCHEVREVRPELVMAVVVVSFDGCVLDRAVHSLDLAVGPRMVGLCEAMFDPVGLTDHVETHGPRINGVPVPGLLGELNAIVGEDGVDLIWHGLEHVLQELPSRLPVCLLDQLGHGELARAVNADEQEELSFGSLNLGDVDMEEAYGVALELRPLRLVTLDIRQARDAVTLKAPMQR